MFYYLCIFSLVDVRDQRTDEEIFLESSNIVLGEDIQGDDSSKQLDASSSDTSFTSSIVSTASVHRTKAPDPSRRPVFYCGTPVLDCEDVQVGCYVEVLNGLQTDVVLVTKIGELSTDSTDKMVGGTYFKCKGSVKNLPTNAVYYQNTDQYWQYPLSDVKTILKAPQCHKVSAKRFFYEFPEIHSTQDME